MPNKPQHKNKIDFKPAVYRVQSKSRQYNFLTDGYMTQRNVSTLFLIALNAKYVSRCTYMF